jgi:hypothetical protein
MSQELANTSAVHSRGSDDILCRWLTKMSLRVSYFVFYSICKVVALWIYINKPTYDALFASFLKSAMRLSGAGGL